MNELHFVCTDFPGPGSECVFVECEDENGHDINAGEWRREGHFAVLVVKLPEVADASLRSRNAALVAGLVRIRDTACDAAQVARETLEGAGETGEARR